MISLIVTLGSAAIFVFPSLSKPRVLAVDEVPIAFWAWRTNAPAEEDIEEVFAATRARTLFLHAGQFDSANGNIERIRGVSGPLPTTVELHLVYNGTRGFLTNWEHLRPLPIARSIAEVYRSDLLRAHGDGSNVLGIQLDLDVPTRLLPSYGAMLRELRSLLHSDTKLSITGLPTWMTSNEIDVVLDAVDFWIPQLYGAEIPTHVTDRIPISSASEVARTITNVRLQGRPFYAGLSAYGYALLYAEDGDLLELRGDLDPTLAESSSALELVERKMFKGDANAGQIRYEYRATNDVVIDGLIMQAGQTLVFDLPSVASLKASATSVRENAGDLLLGICIFRLPTTGDDAVLGAHQIAPALTNIEPKIASRITWNTSEQNLQLRTENIGTADSVTIDVAVPPGSVDRVIDLEGFSSYEVLCRSRTDSSVRRCSDRRGDVIRFKNRWWNPGAKASATLKLRIAVPETLSAVVTTRVDARLIETQTFELRTTEKENE